VCTHRCEVIHNGIDQDATVSTTPGISPAHIRVRDAMHAGIVTCEPETSMRVVARLMAEHRVHAVAVADPSLRGRHQGVISDLEVAAAVATGTERTAAASAVTEPVTVSSDDRLDHAAQLMVEHELTHLIVLDPASGHPVGVLSTLDLAAVYGNGAVD
jgi:CBS domain-containing protein